MSYASPFHPLLSNPLATIGRPGHDGRKRRYRNSSDDSDETSIDGFITEDLRVGGPYLCSIPLYSLTVPDTHHLARFVGKDQQKFMDSVASILRNHNVDYMSFDICGRQSKIDPEKSPVPTLLVHANRHGLDNSWVNASRAISAYLKCEGQTGVSVEIVDPKLYDPLQYSSVLPTDAIFLVWDQVLEAILARINLADVNTVGCYRIGKSRNKHNNPPTIYITVSRSSSSRPWKDVREQVVNILNRFSLTAAGVLIVKGEIQKVPDPSDPQLPPQQANSTPKLE